MNFIGSGVVFHIPTFFSELKELEEQGLTWARDKVRVSDRVNVLLDMHMAVDGLEEQELGDSAIGTTKRGNISSERYAGSFLSAALAPLQALPYMNSRASDSIKETESNVRQRHWSMLSNKQSGKKLT